MERNEKTSLLDRIFSWSMEDILNKDLYKQKVFISFNLSSLVDMFRDL